MDFLKMTFMGGLTFPLDHNQTNCGFCLHTSARSEIATMCCHGHESLTFVLKQLEGGRPPSMSTYSISKTLDDHSSTSDELEKQCMKNRGVHYGRIDANSSLSIRRATASDVMDDSGKQRRAKGRDERQISRLESVVN